MRVELGGGPGEVSVQPAAEDTVEEEVVELGGGPDIVSPKPTPQCRCYFSAADLSP